MIARLIKVILRESRGVRIGIFCNVVCGCITVLLSLLTVWATREMVNAACNGNRHSVSIIGLAFCMFLLCRILFSKCGQRIESWCITRLSNAVRSRLFDRVMTGGYHFDEDFHSADVVSRLSSDVANLSSTICSTVPSLIVAGISFIGSFFYLVVLVPKLAAVVALLMPVAILLGKLPAAKTYRLTADIRKAETDIYRQLQDDVNHRVLISTIGYSEKAAEEFGKKQMGYFKLTMQRNDLGLLSGGAVTLGFMAGYAVIFFYCVYGILDSTVSFATMTALLQLTAMVQRPVVDMSHKITPLVKAGVSIDRIESLEKKYQPDSEYAFCKGTEFKFENVWFRYNENSGYVLKGFDQTIPSGNVTALYGETGAGKTTILRLMLGLCQPEQGSVYLPYSGHNKANLVYIPQGNSLISGTVESNLMMGNPKASSGEIQEALFLADAEFVLALPDGIMTKCGENGYGFSEGQAQRIAIARGIIRYMSLRNADEWPIVLLMDEPTSSLDSETERLILDRIIPYLNGDTLVIVTHKDSIRRYADKVIVI